jgi:hypothetical protein
LDENQKDEWRKAATTANKENPNKLTEIIRWVNQLIEERRKKWQKQKAAGAE